MKAKKEISELLHMYKAICILDVLFDTPVFRTNELYKRLNIQRQRNMFEHSKMLALLWNCVRREEACLRYYHSKIIGISLIDNDSFAGIRRNQSPPTAPN